MLISILSVIQPANAALTTTTKLDLTDKNVETGEGGTAIHTLPTNDTCRNQGHTPYWDNSTSGGTRYPTAAAYNETAYGSPFCVFLHPGVGDANKTGWSHTLDTLYGTQYAYGKDDVLPYNPVADPKTTFPGKPLTNAQTRQVFDKYLDYAILSSSSDSIGDFQFDIQVVTTIFGLRIYVPPEFKWLAPTADEAVWTDITNDYQYVSVSVPNKYDVYAPGWTRVTIGRDNGENNALTILPGVYHIRFFNLRAPDAAGLYFFKMRFYPSLSPTSLDIGPGNYPFVIVKSELNPAYVEVTVKTDTYSAPPYVSGQVTAEGTTPEGRAVKGVAYWGPINYAGPASGDIFGSATYMTYLFGLAAGTYTLTAQASGFNPTVTDRITLNAGQSYTKWIVIGSSPTVSVVVWSKHGTGAIPWHNLWQAPFGTNNPDAAPSDAVGQPRRDILLNLYDANGNLINWWGSDWFANIPWRSPAGDWGDMPFGGRGIALSPGRDAAAGHSYVTVPIPGTNQLFGLHDDGATHPTMTSYHALLVDNYDPTFLFTTDHSYAINAVGVWTDPTTDPGHANLRMYPSTMLDGHVPWAYADYIAGMPNGQYGIESYVTGYVMDDSDSYQTTFVLGGSHYELQMDLRRSNWLETVLHLDFAAISSPGATFVLTAEDAAGNERAAVSFVATVAMLEAHDPRIDGNDIITNTPIHTYAAGPYPGGIVIEGWNLVFPYTIATASDSQKDYGLNPTASTHSAHTVILAGNPYTIKVYAADMGKPYAVDPTNPYDPNRGTGWFQVIGTPQASVFLCNTPVSLSFGLVRAKLWISLRSTDFEVPAHSRPWTFPGSDVYVSFMDSSGNVVDTLAPYWYGVVQDPGVRNDTTLLTGDNHYLTLNKNAFKIPGVDYTAANVDADHGYGLTPFDVDNVNLPGHHEHIGVMYYGTDPTSTAAVNFPNVGPWYALGPWIRPTRLEPGEYSYKAFTHGYVMRRSFPVQVPFAGTADIEADLIQGGQIRVYLSFAHEGIATNFNGFVRVEVFNSAGDLVGGDIYGQAQPNLFTRAGNGGTYLDYNPTYDWQMGGFLYGWYASAAAGLGNLTGPALHAPWGQFPSASAGQRAYQSSNIYGVPYYPFDTTSAIFNGIGTWSGWGHMVPSDANRLFLPAGAAQAYDVYGFNWYFGGPTRTWAGGWPTTDGTSGDGRDYGLSGSVDIAGWSGSGAGLYTVKVWAFDPSGPDWTFEKSGLSDDWRMYSMAAELKDIQLPWGGAVEYWMTMDDMAKLSGTIRWFDMYGDLRPLPWSQITATDPAFTSVTPPEGYPAYGTGLGAIGAGSSDSAGAFVMWLPPGSHDVSISTSEAPGVWSSSAPTSNAQYTVVVSPGWVGGGDSQVGPSGTAVPELPPYLAAFTLLGALAASVWFLRKKTVNIPVLMK